jgi:hypothetical protein
MIEEKIIDGQLVKLIGNIVLQEKCKGDWRAFVSCRDEDGNWWQLRAYGTTPGGAATNAYERYQSPTDSWGFNGYQVPPL